MPLAERERQRGSNWVHSYECINRISELPFHYELRNAIDTKGYMDGGIHESSILGKI